MNWKYSHCLAPCYCHGSPPTLINFTTLIPMNDKTTCQDCNMIEKVGKLLKYRGFKFWSCSVMLINHKHVEKSDIIKCLNEQGIYSERII